MVIEMNRFIIPPLIYFTSLDQDQYFRLNNPPRLQPVEIDPSRQAVGIPINFVHTEGKIVVHERFDLLAQEVEDFQGDKCGLGEGKTNRSGWGEWIGIILVKNKAPWHV